MPVSAAPPRDRPAPLQARRLVCGALALGLLFELAGGLGTQDKAIYRAMPWHDDPYHAVLLAALLTVGPLMVVLGARMLVWSAPGRHDRARQMLRAAGVLVAAIAIASGLEWAAVAEHARARAWNGATTLQIAALVLTTVATAWLACGLTTARPAYRTRWTEDWLGDAARIPAFGRAVPAGAVAWIRRRAILVFATASLLVALPIVAAQAIGEGWTDPVLIGWMLAVLTASLFAFCVIANALAGFVARPPRSRGRRIAEASLVAGCLGVQAGEAFHDQIWRALTGHLAGTVGDLVAITAGTGLLALAICAAALLARRDRPPAPGGRVTPASTA